MASDNKIIAAADAPLTGEVGSTDRLAAFQSLGLQLNDRNTLQDSAVNIVDTLQSIGSIPLAALPGFKLSDAGDNSQALNDFRSPAYLAEQALEQLNFKPTDTFLEGAGQAIENTFSGGNLVADLASQVPYLALGPAARLTGVARAEKAAGVLGKVARLTAGTNEIATVNRLAALSGITEGAGAYSQTYQRAIADGATDEDATAQAEKAGLVSTVLGAALGKLTPGFELHPTGTRLSSLASHASEIAGEALVEEGGLAIAQTVTDNILAGKDPMDGVGSQFGQAVAVSGAFAGGLRTPTATLALAKEVGNGVVKGIKGLADKAVTPEKAAANQAEAEVRAQRAQEPPITEVDLTDAPPVEPVVEPTDPIEAQVRADLANSGLEGDALEAAVAQGIAAQEPDVVSSDRRYDPIQRKAVEELSPEEKDVEIQRLRERVDNPIDDTTGLVRSDAAGDDALTPVQRELNTAVENSADEESHWVSFDVANLGGLNEHVGNVAADANAHYKALVDIAKATLKEGGFETKGFRTGGDEFGMVVTKGDVDLPTALDAVRSRINEYTVRNGLDAIPNPKGKAPGLNLHVGSTRVVPGDTVDTIRNRADRDLDASKKGKPNVRRIPTVAPRGDARNPRSQEDRGTGSAARPSVREGAEEAPRQVTAEVDTDSSSATIKAVLVDAANDALIESTTGAEQAKALARKEELAPEVKAARAKIEKLSDERVANAVEQAAKGNKEAARVVEAVKRTDVSKVPEAVLDDNVKPIAKQIKQLKDLKINQTSSEILEQGFNGAMDSRGVRGYLQDLVNLAALGVDAPNETSKDLVRFVTHLQDRAQAFRDALAKPLNDVDVEGTKTRTANGGLSSQPFVIHKLNANSMAVVDRVFEDVTRAQDALDQSMQSFPGMFKGVKTVAKAAVKPVEQPAPVLEPEPVVEQRAPSAGSDVVEFDAPVVAPAQSATAAPSPPASAPPVAAELSLEEAPEFNRAAALQDFETQDGEPLGQRIGMPPITQVTAPDGEGYIAYIPGVNNSRQIVSAFVPPGGRGKGYGKANLLELAKQTQEAGETLNSDTSVSAAQLRVYESLKADGQLSFDYADPEAAAVALKDGAKLSSTQPVIINIKPATPVLPGTIPFAAFNGVNRFAEAFKPNGGGMLAKSYGELITQMKAGNEEEQRAAATLEKLVPNFRNAITNYVTAELDKPVSKKDSTKLKDALAKNQAFPDYTNYVWAHLLTQKPDGSYALHPAVVDSAAVAGVMQLVRGAFLRSENVDEATDQSDDQYYQWISNMGKDAMRILGVDADTTKSTTLEDGIPKALGATILGVLDKEGDVKVTTSVYGNKTLKNVTMSDGVRDVLREFPAFPEVMRKFIGRSDDDTIHYGEAPTAIKQTYRNSRTLIQPEQRAALGNRQKVVHYRNTGFLNVLNALGDKYTELVTGFTNISTDERLAELSRSLVVGIQGERNAVIQYNAGIELHAKQEQIAAEEVPVHFSYEILRNGRSFSGYSPQTKKTLREFLTVGRETLDLSNPVNVRFLKLAIAQSIGIKTDINTHDQIIAQLDARIPELTAVATAMYRASQGETVPELAGLLDRDDLYEPKELHGLMTLGSLLANPTSNAFVNTLTFEIDGKTNGPFMAELLFGLHRLDKKSLENLEQGGFFFGVDGETLATMQDTLREKYGSLDLYGRVASNAVVAQDEIIRLAGFTNETGAITRTAAKEAVTPLVYGSGVSSLTAVFATRLNSGLMQRLRIAIRQGDAKMAAKLRGMIEVKLSDEIREIRAARASGNLAYAEQLHESLLATSKIYGLGNDLSTSLAESYASEKPQVTETNDLMVAAASLHAGVRKAIFLKQVEALVQKKRDSGELPKQYTLSKADYNKILKSMPDTAVNIPGMGQVVVAESSNTGRSSTRVEGIGKVNSVQISMPEIKNPGVSVLALSTIGGGDAAMGNQLFQKQEQVLDVYDGIEMSVGQINDMGMKLNEAVWTSASDSLLDNFDPMMDWLLKNQGNLFNDDTKKTLKSLRKKYGVATNKQAVEALRAELALKSAQIKAGRARLNAKPSSLNQMSGGGVGYMTPGSQETRDAAAAPDFRKDWDAKVEATFDAANGKLDRDGVVAMLDRVKWQNAMQKFVWQKLRGLLPAGVSVELAKTEAEWNAAYGENAPSYGSVSGTTFIDSGRVLLATTSPTIMLHELIHTVFSSTLSQYFANINLVPTELRAPINDLVQLMERFRKVKTEDDSVKMVQGIVEKNITNGDTASAVDEMLTYALSDPEVMEAYTPGFVTRVLTRAKQILWGIFGKEVPGTFLDEVMASFSKLVAGPSMKTNEIQGIRNHVAHDPLRARTEAAFKALAQKMARGQNYKVPKLAGSNLSKVQTQFNLSVDQQRLYKRVWMLLRMETRPAELEKFASTVIAAHPNGNLFTGAKDGVADVMALAAVDATFAAQADAIWTAAQPKKFSAAGLVNAALNGSTTASSESLLTNALDAMAEDAEYNLSFLGAATQRLDRLGNEWMEKIGDKAFQASQKAPGGVAEILQGIHALTTEVGAEAFGKGLLRAVNEFTNQRWLQDGMAALVGSQNDTNAVYRQVNTMKSNVAQTRSMFTITLPAELKKLFPEGFDGWNHLYNHFGRVDAGVLGAAAGQMFSDDIARGKMIKALSSKISNPWDAANLAHYMIHGKVTKGSPHALLRNARAIADNLNANKKKASDSTVADVDQLVTLMAIDFMAPADRARIAGYFTQHPVAMNSLTGMLAKVSEEDAKQFRDSHRYIYWKGALPLSTDPRASVVLAGPTKGAALEALGYKKRQKYVAGSGDPVDDLYYYTRDYAPPPAFSQGVLATVQQTAMGINYTTSSTISPEVGTMITSPRLVNYITRNLGRDSNLTPIFNFDGDIVGYERLLDRKIVQEATHADGTLLHIAVGAKLGRILEERLAERFNKEAIDILVNQWKAGQAMGEEAQYEDVTSTTDKQIARAWEVIPAPTKKALEDAFEGPVMIRKDLLANTLGYHKAGVNDIFTGDASLSETTRKAMYGLAQTVMGPSAAKYLYAAELAIKEGVATAKDWIIVRSLSVAINNAMASMNLVVANGVPLKDLFTSYREGIRDVRAYGRLSKEIIELTVKIAGSTGAEKAKLKSIQDGKRAAVKRLAIYPLIEAGELSDLPEGLEDTPQHSYLGDFAAWANDYLKRIHPKAPNVVANAFIAKDSQFHDGLSKAIQAGDFLGKWAVYKHMVKSGKSPEVARDTVRDEFVSYSTNPGRFRGALEDFGLVWWSQFTLRAQKVLLRRFRRNPFSFFMSTVGGNIAGVDTPADAALWERGWDNSTGLDTVANAPSAHIWAKVF